MTIDERMSSSLRHHIVLGCLLTALASTSLVAGDSLPSQGPAVRLLRLMSTSPTDNLRSKWRPLETDPSQSNSVKEDRLNNEENVRWTDSDDDKFDEDSDMLVSEKRKWAGNGMTIWGKRGKWAKNNLQVWGKRHFGVPAEVSNFDALENEPIEDQRALWASDEEDEKRNWAKNGMKIWGKRDEEWDNDDENEEKRNWAKNGMKIWGKRGGGELLHLEELMDSEPHSSENSWNRLGTYPYQIRSQQIPETSKIVVRKISSFSGLPGVWGKSGPYVSARNYPKRISTRNGIKKGWASNNMRIWGK